MSALSRTRVRVLLMVGAALAALLAVPGEVNAQSTGPEVETVATGLEVPWGIDFLPSGDALVTERGGRVVRVTSSGQVTPVGTIPGVSAVGEGGLLDLEVSPSFASDRYVYFYYTATGSQNRIIRTRYENGQLGSPEEVLGGIPAGFIHNGGRIAFGPDGMLYAGTGESGNRNLAQDTNSLAGKILRMTPDGDPAPGNPLGNHVWSYGHRNVQGLAWDDDGRLYASEFGENQWDEVNLIEPGDNYGWPNVEGSGGGAQYTDPLVTWRPAEASPSGAAILDGSLWIGALRGSRLWEVPLTGGGVGTPVAHLVSEYGRLRAAEVAPDGTLWVSTTNRDGRGSPAPQDDRILSVTVDGGGGTTTTTTTAPGSTTSTTQPDPGECFTATNSEHSAAGRAQGFVTYTAVGSGDSLGWWFETTSLEQSSPGTWTLVGSCGGGGGPGGPASCFTATNSEHSAAGRAQGFVTYTAVGSGDSLGWWFETTSLEQSSPGTWTLVPGC